MRVRKRVTLMVVTVTAISGICWLTEMIVHTVDSFLSYSIDKDVYTVTHTLILFSSAANPFEDALINQNFKEKIKRMVCCAPSTAVIDPATRQAYFIELVNVTQPNYTLQERVSWSEVLRLLFDKTVIEITAVSLFEKV